jgi:hypothetical protein
MALDLSLANTAGRWCCNICIVCRSGPKRRGTPAACAYTTATHLGGYERPPVNKTHPRPLRRATDVGQKFQIFRPKLSPQTLAPNPRSKPSPQTLAPNPRPKPSLQTLTPDPRPKPSPQTHAQNPPNPRSEAYPQTLAQNRRPKPSPISLPTVSWKMRNTPVF